MGTGKKWQASLSHFTIGVAMISGKALLEVTAVKVEKKYTLVVHFSNGKKRRIDLSPLMSAPPPVFIKLLNAKEFKRVSVNPVGGIQWACGVDLSADYLMKYPR